MTPELWCLLLGHARSGETKRLFPGQRPIERCTRCNGWFNSVYKWSKQP